MRKLSASASSQPTRLHSHGWDDRAAETTDPLWLLNNCKPRNHPLSWSQSLPALRKRPNRPQPLSRAADRQLYFQFGASELQKGTVKLQNGDIKFSLFR